MGFYKMAIFSDSLRMILEVLLKVANVESKITDVRLKWSLLGRKGQCWV